MPVKKASDLKDPVGTIARKIERDGNDFSYGKPSEKDFVIWAENILELPRNDELEDALANRIFEDAGEDLWSAERLAAFIYANLTVSAG